MRTGTLRRRITIQQSVDTQNTFGEPVPAWATVSTVWAYVEPIAGKEYISSKQIVGMVDTKFVIRYRIGLTVRPKMKVIYNGEDYDIESVLNVRSANKELHLMCRKAA